MHGAVGTRDSALEHPPDIRAWLCCHLPAPSPAHRAAAYKRAGLPVPAAWTPGTPPPALSPGFAAPGSPPLLTLLMAHEDYPAVRRGEGGGGSFSPFHSVPVRSKRVERGERTRVRRGARAAIERWRVSFSAHSHRPGALPPLLAQAPLPTHFTPPLLHPSTPIPSIHPSPHAPHHHRTLSTLSTHPPNPGPAPPQLPCPPPLQLVNWREVQSLLRRLAPAHGLVEHTVTLSTDAPFASHLDTFARSAVVVGRHGPLLATSALLPPGEGGAEEEGAGDGGCRYRPKPKAEQRGGEGVNFEPIP